SPHRSLHSIPTRRSSDLNGLMNGFSTKKLLELRVKSVFNTKEKPKKVRKSIIDGTANVELFELLRELRNVIAHENDLIHYQIFRSEEHTSELQSRENLVC